jgi:hypothetical protein
MRFGMKTVSEFNSKTGVADRNGPSLPGAGAATAP